MQSYFAAIEIGKEIKRSLFLEEVWQVDQLRLKEVELKWLVIVKIKLSVS